VKFRVEPAGDGYFHPVTSEEVAERISLLPKKYLRNLEVVQFSRMTRKRALFPCYGMQWGTAVYLYPIEASLTETYVAPPRPEQIIEARMFGGRNSSFLDRERYANWFAVEYGYRASRGRR
jgi:hypothetical protein